MSFDLCDELVARVIGFYTSQDVKVASDITKLDVEFIRYTFNPRRSYSGDSFVVFSREHVIKLAEIIDSIISANIFKFQRF